MIFLPESFDYLEEDKNKSLEAAETIDGPLIKSFKSLAKSLDIWLSLGGFHEKVYKISKSRFEKTSLIFSKWLE